MVRVAPSSAHYIFPVTISSMEGVALQCQGRFGASTLWLIPIFYQATYADGLPNLIVHAINIAYSEFLLQYQLTST